ncbi:DUF11 domain-containing protein [Paenibacillus urinalis]|uniref:DUF11 domain-containing protein n=1 Tax=Paenibacillus urinalis TaxID=521520 RepID=A0ABY7XF36_9BACL|nr:DUF11 domain-containing protein [Paenibacillus urinalis]WDH96162.1 DUF11 domain-containing protein [Paenibacillus urinalis]WDI04385.1 DUF11 domain-containing protein [Paenibacillus urinalis]
MSLDPNQGRRLQNQTSVTFISGASDGVAYSNLVSIPLTGPVITLQKSASVTQAALGSIITYELNIANTGNADAEITVRDAIPEGMQFIANSVIRNGQPLPGVDVTSPLNIGIVASSSGVNISFQAIVTSIPPSNELYNVASAAYTFQTLDGRTITREVTSNGVRIALANAQLTISQRANTLQTFVGDVITFTVTIQNTGSVPVINARLSVMLSAGLSFVPGSVILNGIISPGLDPVQGFILPVINPGEVVQLTYQVRVLSVSRPLSSEVFVTYSSDGLPVQTGSNEVILSPVEPVVNMVVTVMPEQVTYGGAVQFTAEIRNEGDLPIEAVYYMNFPQGLIFEDYSVQINGVEVHNANPVLGIRLGTLFPRSRTVISYRALVSFTPYSRITQMNLINQAALQFTYRLTDSRTVSLREETEVQVLFLAPVIQAELTSQPVRVERGDDVTIRILVRNTGNLAAALSLRGLIPPGTALMRGILHFQDGTIKPFSIQDLIDGILIIGVLEPGQYAEIEYIVRVNIEGLLPSDLLKGYVTVLFTYLFENKEYTLEVHTNEYIIVIEQHDE